MTTTMGAESAQAGLHRADGVQLIGEMAGSGYRVPPSLVRRADGQVVQLTPLLYAVLREIDGSRNAGEVASAVSASTDRSVSEDNVAHLVDKLRPLGLLVEADGSQPQLKKRNPLLGLRFRYAVTDPVRTRRLTDPFQFLFRTFMLIPMLAAFVVVCWWVFFSKGLAHAAYDAFQRPGLLILVFAITVLSAGFHEFGHAAAARYGGSTPGVMGFGLYLVWPAFYTDVTDSYRLGRAGRLRTDLGGLYFNAIVAVAITGVWWCLHYDALLLVIATQILQMLRQLAPTVRFDGYHVLADITGVPDLYSRIKPTLLGVLPGRWHDPAARQLKPWARAVVTVWVLVVVPLLLSGLWVAILALPRLLGTAWESIGRQQHVLTTAWADGDMIQATARVLAMVAIVIPVAGTIYMLVRLARSTAVRSWHGSAGKPATRALVLVLGAAVLSAIAYAWWPREGTYRPIEASERGTLFDISLMPSVHTTRTGPTHTVTSAVRPAAAATLVKGQQGVMRTVWDTRTAAPTKQSPKLALVLVPKAKPWAGGDGGGTRFAAPAQMDKGWVFPVDKPLAPEPGDNQALAVNTIDGTVDYEAAFALVWQTDESYAMNVNEAQAYASCNSCASVAIAYQVVFVVDNDDSNDNVAVPQNLAGSLNYKCVNCLTYSLAKQLFVTLDAPLSDEAMAKLDVLWKEIAAYGEKVEAGQVRLNEIDAQLEKYNQQIKDIVEADQPGTFPSSPATPTPTVLATVTASPTPAPIPSATGSPTGSPTASATASLTPPPSLSAPSSPTQSATASPAAPSTGSSLPSGTSTATPSAPSNSTAPGGSATDGSTSGASTSGGSSSSGSTSGGS